MRFDPPTRGTSRLFELRVRDPGGGEPARYELTIAHGACTVRAGAARSAGAVAEIGAD